MQRICLLVVDDDEGDAASISRMVHLRTQLRDFYDETAEVRVDTSSVASRRHDTLDSRRSMINYKNNVEVNEKSDDCEFFQRNITSQTITDVTQLKMTKQRCRRPVTVHVKSACLRSPELWASQPVTSVT